MALGRDGGCQINTRARALAFGLGRLEDARPNVRALIGALGAVGPSEELRVLAIAALRRVRVRGASAHRRSTVAIVAAGAASA